MPMEAGEIERLIKEALPDAQVEIREKIRRRQGNDELKAYLERLKAEVPVWTILDEPA